MINDPLEQALRNVGQEIMFARRKFPSTDDILASITEELGELAQALQEQKHEPEKGKTSEDVYNEAIQVAATALRLAVDGSPNYPQYVPVPPALTIHYYAMRGRPNGNT